MIKKLLVCSALIALGSAAQNQKWLINNGGPHRHRKNEAASFLQASQDDVVQHEDQDVLYGQDYDQYYGQDYGQDVVNGQTDGENLYYQVILPLLENLDDLDALEKTGRLESPEDVENTLDILQNLKFNLETLDDVKRAVGTAQDQQPSVLLEHAQDAESLADLISKTVEPIIKDLDGNFNTKSTPVLLQQLVFDGDLRALIAQYVDPIMKAAQEMLKASTKKRRTSLLEANNEFFGSPLFRRKRKNEASALLESQNEFFGSPLFRRKRKNEVSALLESQNEFFGSPLFRRKRKNEASALLESENEFFGSPLFRRKRKNETPALLQAQTGVRNSYNKRNIRV